MTTTNRTAPSTWAENIPALKIEANDDGTLSLEQDWVGNVDRVTVHPVHIRLVAERLGLVREMSASDADMLRTESGRVAALRQENDRLKRNLLRLREHALALQEGFREHADWKHADLAHDMAAINALVDLFDMAVDDFADDYTAHEPSGNPQATQTEPTGSAAELAPATPPLPKKGRLGQTPAVAAPPQQMHPCSACAPQQLQLEG